MTDSASQDHYYMQTALNLSLRGQGNTWPNPSVGTVIVKKNKIEDNVVLTSDFF